MYNDFFILIDLINNTFDSFHHTINLPEIILLERKISSPIK